MSEGYNVLIPDICRDRAPELMYPIMAALQELHHTPVVMEMESISAMYRQMRYERHGCYEIFEFYVKDLYKKYKIDFGFTAGLGIVLEDAKKDEAHNLLEEAAIPHLVFFHSRDYSALPNLQRLKATTWQHAFFAATTRSMVDRLKEAGLSRVLHLPLGTSLRIFYPRENPPANAPFPVRGEDAWVSHGYEVSFVGSYCERRVEYLTALAQAGVKLAIWGDSRWSQCQQLLPYYRQAAHYLHDVNTIYNMSQVNLDLPHDNTALPDYFSLRLQDCLASCNFIATYDRERLSECVEPSHEVAVFQDPADLVQVVRYYLEHDLERNMLAARGHARIRNQASWENRLSRALPRLEIHLLTCVA